VNDDHCGFPFEVVGFPSLQGPSQKLFIINRLLFVIYVRTYITYQRFGCEFFSFIFVRFHLTIFKNIVIVVDSFAAFVTYLTRGRFGFAAWWCDSPSVNYGVYKSFSKWVIKHQDNSRQLFWTRNVSCGFGRTWWRHFIAKWSNISIQYQLQYWEKKITIEINPLDRHRFSYLPEIRYYGVFRQWVRRCGNCDNSNHFYSFLFRPCPTHRTHNDPKRWHDIYMVHFRHFTWRSVYIYIYIYIWFWILHLCQAFGL